MGLRPTLSEDVARHPRTLELRLGQLTLSAFDLVETFLLTVNFAALGGAVAFLSIPGTTMEREMWSALVIVVSAFVIWGALWKNTPWYSLQDLLTVKEEQVHEKNATVMLSDEEKQAQVVQDAQAEEEAQAEEKGEEEEEDESKIEEVGHSSEDEISQNVGSAFQARERNSGSGAERVRFHCNRGCSYICTLQRDCAPVIQRTKRVHDSFSSLGERIPVDHNSRVHPVSSDERLYRYGCGMVARAIHSQRFGLGA